MLKVGLLGRVAMHAVVGTGFTYTAGFRRVRPDLGDRRDSGPGGAPPYLVRRDDGHEALVFPGPDASVEHPKNRQFT